MEPGHRIKLEKARNAAGAVVLPHLKKEEGKKKKKKKKEREMQCSLALTVSAAFP
jgi:hypothetical protein